MTGFATRQRLIFRCIAIFLGAFYAWSYRFAMNADGITYLDMADAFRRGDWRNLINANFGPLYSCMLGLATIVLLPTPYWEFPMAHLVNFMAFLSTLLAFEYLLKQLSVWRLNQAAVIGSDGWGWLTEDLWVSLCYISFLFGIIDVVTLVPVTPDMLIAGPIFWAAGVAVRIQNGDSRTRTFALLGAVLGLGYLVKTPMLIHALVFLGVSWIATGALWKTMPRVVVGLAVFLLIAALFFVPMSKIKGHLSFGDSGRINYAWWVLDARMFPSHPEGSPELGVPKHPFRLLVKDPAIYEYRDTVGGTYPGWFDPAYWYEGIKLHLDLKRWVDNVEADAQEYGQIYQPELGLLVCLVALFMAGIRRPHVFRISLLPYSILIPALAGLTMFGLSHVQNRYVGPLIALLWIGLFSGVRLPSDEHSQRRIRALVLILLIGPIFHLMRVCAATIRRGVREQTMFGNPPGGPLYWQVAQGLREAGLKDGDWVGSLYDSYSGYWARLARVRIMAEAEDPDQFWRATPDAQEKAILAMQAIGIKALVSKRDPTWRPTPGWLPVGQTHYFIRLLGRP
jgi:hypothetical protein